MTSLDFNKEALLELADHAHEHSISIFIPTHRRGKEVLEGQDSIAFKNHVQAIRHELEAQTLPSNEIDALMLPLDALLDDPQFWRHRSEGLAVFRSSDHFFTFDSPVPLDDFHKIGPQFWVRPLLSYVQPSRQYFLLQIGKNGVVLYQADQYAITVVETSDAMPSGMEEVTKHYDFEQELQGRTKGVGGMTAMYSSDDNDNKDKDHLLADYFRLVDEAVMKLNGTQTIPLLLASVAYYQPIYRQVNSYPYLHAGGLTGNFDHVQIGEMHQMANEALGNYFEESRMRRIVQYQNNSGSELVSRDLRQILEAAVTGRIEALFVRHDARAWGHFNEETLTATIHENENDGDTSLIDQAALLTLRHGGEVYLMDEVKLLNNRSPVMITALYRF